MPDNVSAELPPPPPPQSPSREPPQPTTQARRGNRLCPESGPGLSDPAACPTHDASRPLAPGSEPRPGAELLPERSLDYFLVWGFLSVCREPVVALGIQQARLSSHPLEGLVSFHFMSEDTRLGSATWLCPRSPARINAKGRSDYRQPDVMVLDGCSRSFSELK